MKVARQPRLTPPARIASLCIPATHRPPFTNCLLFTSFADSHILTLVDSHRCKNRGGGPCSSDFRVSLFDFPSSIFHFQFPILDFRVTFPRTFIHPGGPQPC